MSIYTDKLVNKLTPDEQIASLFTYNDTVSEAEKARVAEKVGLSVASGTSGVTSAASPNFVDATYAAFTLGDAHRWLYVTGTSGGVQDGFHYISEYVSASTVKTATTFTASDSGLSWTMYREPNLQDDINIAITQLRQIIDPTYDWFQPMPRAFDPADTDGSNTKNEKMSLKVLADNWLGTKTEILDVITNPISVTNGDTGKLYVTSLTYADPADRRGLVIQASTANAGSYFDEVALASIVLGKHKVMLEDAVNGDEFQDSSGNVIYGVLQDGADNSGTGEGTDVFIKFVHDVVGVPTAYTWTAADPASIKAYLPQRKKVSEMLEYDRRRAFVSSIVGDAETHEDIANLWAALGLADGENAGDWDINFLTDYYPLATLATAGVLNGTVTAEDMFNALNEEIGDRLYTDNNIISDGETITESLDKLDQVLASSGLKAKIIERVTSDITRGTAHNVPFTAGVNVNVYNPNSITTYRVDSTNNVGLYMDIWVGGKKLVPDSGTSTQDGEYDETSNTSWTPRFTIKSGQIIEYVVKDT